MNKKTADALLLLRMVFDMVVVCASWVASYYIRFSGAFEIPKGVPEPMLYIKMLPFVFGIWVFTFAFLGFYKRTGRHRSPLVEALDIIQNCIMATLLFIAFTYVYEEYRYSRLTMLIFVVLHPFAIISARSVVRKVLRYYRRKLPPKRTLIIGSGENLRHALDMGRLGNLNRGEIAGVVLVGEEKDRAAGYDMVKKINIPMIEVPKDWVSFFAKYKIDSVVIALPHSVYKFLDDNLDAIADQVGEIKLIPDLIRYTRFAAGVDVISGTPVVSINESPLAGIGGVVKRFTDVLGGLLGLVLFGPLMVLIALLVKLSSRGPIIFRQTRMGLDGRNFECLKFRTMPTDVEAKTGAVWAKKGDNRSTWIGGILRKTSLDELPQFYNVLKGEMSLVGPRPERPVFVEQFRRDVPGYYLRHKVKAGITGWAQVNGWRGNTSIEKRIECDLFYIQNWSLWLDIRILFATVFKGFLNKNAY